MQVAVHPGMLEHYRSVQAVLADTPARDVPLLEGAGAGESVWAWLTREEPAWAWCVCAGHSLGAAEVRDRGAAWSRISPQSLRWRRSRAIRIPSIHDASDAW